MHESSVLILKLLYSTLLVSTYGFISSCLYNCLYDTTILYRSLYIAQGEKNQERKYILMNHNTIVASSN